MDLFKNAAAKPIAATPKAKGKVKAEVPIEGVEKLAMVKALTDALETVGSTFEASVKAIAWGRFCTLTHETGRRPDSFKGTEGIASASLELRKRGTNMALSPQAVELLRAAGFEPGEETIVPELYAINPAYAGDVGLLGKVSAALAGVVPEDFVILQPKQVKYIVTEELIEKAFSSKAAPEVLQAITTLACKPALQVTNITRILEFVRDLLTGPTPKAAANEGEQPKAAA